MHEDSKIKLVALKVDGGASANQYLMQTQADIINVPVTRPECVETTALGAAYLAGLAVGFWNDLSEISDNVRIDKVFNSSISQTERNTRIKGWKKAVRYAFDWAKED